MSDLVSESASSGSSAIGFLRPWLGRAILVSTSALASYLFYLSWGKADQSALTPALLLCVIFVIFATLLHAREGRVPLSDIGFICAAVSLCYLVLPVLFYVLSGSEWTPSSDARLQTLLPDQAQLAAFGWDGVMYVLPLCLAYMLTRGGRMPTPLPLQPIKVDETCGALAVFGVCRAYQWTVEKVYSTQLITSMSNEEIATQIAGQSALPFPHVIAQLNNVIQNVALISKIYIIVLLIRLWRHSRWIPPIVISWLAFEAYSTVQLGGARTYLAFLFLAALISYHRFVRPLSGPEVAIAGFFVMAGLLVYGYYRDFYFYYFDFKEIDVLQLLSANNEFQVLLATALDVKRLVATGVIAPWQVRWSEFINFIPQQIAPFEKMDPSNWYLTLHGSSGGLMFGVMSQAAVGAGRVELVVRGILLGVALGLINRTFARPGLSMTAAVFYVWLVIKIYYTYRATTFYIMTEALLYFAPFVVLTKIAAAIFHPVSNVVRYGSK
jgi:hypothetical protein